jgi:hypothetical protein
MIRVVHPGSGSFFLPIPDQVVKKAQDLGSGSATLVYSISCIPFLLEAKFLRRNRLTLCWNQLKPCIQCVCKPFQILKYLMLVYGTSNIRMIRRIENLNLGKVCFEKTGLHIEGV